jgi:hypothetical protein
MPVRVLLPQVMRKGLIEKHERRTFVQVRLCVQRRSTASTSTRAGGGTGVPR